jgi:signal transduction histidine kinase
VPDILITDEQRVKQVLLNLLNNALKFTMKGSISVKVTFNNDSSHLIVSVTDTGIGISEEDQ